MQYDSRVLRLRGCGALFDTFPNPNIPQDDTRLHVAITALDYFQYAEINLLPWPP